MSHAQLVVAGSGFLLGSGFIFSIGPQNLQLIRAGALDESPILVATVGYISEIFLVTAGLVLIGFLGEAVPEAEKVLQALGICFLVWCGTATMFCNGTEWRMVPHPFQGSRGRAKALSAMLAVTWLNPLAYLEIMFLTGATASGLDSGSKLCFELGFLSASALRFYGWTAVGRCFQGWLTDQHHGCAFGFVAGTLLLFVAGVLAWRLFGPSGPLA